MDGLKLAAALFTVAALAACDSPPDPEEDFETLSREQATPPPIGAGEDEIASSNPQLVPPVGYPDVVNDGFPDLAPPMLTPEAARGEKGARNLLLTWARAIELKEFDQAWAMMGEVGGAEWSKAEFAALFDGLGTIDVAVPDGRMEGAAGSSYYAVETVIAATGEDGRPVRLEGPLVLRRANDVPGATPEQLSWHFERAELDRTP